MRVLDVVLSVHAFRAQFFQRAYVLSVVVSVVLQGDCKGPLVPRVPAKAIDFVARLSECYVQVLHIESMVWVAAAGIPAVYAKLCSHCDMVEGFA